MISNSNRNSGSNSNLKVVTLNIWAIPYVSKDVDHRVNCLINALNQSTSDDYDIIALQEVWSQKDFKRIKNAIKKKYPHSHYFRSGFVGSGCCVFSKHVIEDVMHHKFSLNGYPHAVMHADWFAGKLVGLAKIKYNQISINVYVTHLHANYSRNYFVDEFSDEYIAHRMVQLYEMGQFIQKNSHTADVSFLLGDLNTNDFEHGFGMFMHQTNLLDAFKEKMKFEDTSNKYGVTCHWKENYYQSAPDIRKDFPNGLRIDYVLFKNSSKLAMKCLEYKNCFGKIPNSELNYSDHEGVSAEFSISLNDQVNSQVNESSKLDLVNYERVKFILKENQNSILKSQLMFLLLSLSFVPLLFSLNEFSPSLALVKNLLLGTLIGCLLFFGLIFKEKEKIRLGNTLNELTGHINKVKKY